MKIFTFIIRLSSTLSHFQLCEFLVIFRSCRPTQSHFQEFSKAPYTNARSIFQFKRKTTSILESSKSDEIKRSIMTLSNRDFQHFLGHLRACPGCSGALKPLERTGLTSFRVINVYWSSLADC